MLLLGEIVGSGVATGTFAGVGVATTVGVAVGVAVGRIVGVTGLTASVLLTLAAAVALCVVFVVKGTALLFALLGAVHPHMPTTTATNTPIVNSFMYVFIRSSPFIRKRNKKN
jgi:hypothetical protein